MTARPASGPRMPGEWGHALKPLWRLDPAMRALNHGAFGAVPIALAAEADEWRRRAEPNPPRFHMSELPGLLREAAAAVAAFVGTRPERLGFVPNATAGINAVLRSLRFAPGDEIVATDHIYNAVRQTLRFVADTTGARVVEAPVGMPVRDPATVLDAVAAALTPRTRLVVIDHVSSPSAVIMPVAAVAALCRARGVPLLVDGAHAPGFLDLAVDAVGADWYVGNGHKWLCGPRSAAFIAVAHRPTTPIHPLPISHAYGQGFTAEFDKTGTFDAAAVLTLPAAIRLHEALGGAALRARGRAVAVAAAERLSKEFGTELGACASLVGPMASVRVPGRLPATRETVALLQQRLREAGYEVAVTPLAGALWLRVSVAPYTDERDFAGLGDALRRAVGAGPGRVTA